MSSGQLASGDGGKSRANMGGVVSADWGEYAPVKVDYEDTFIPGELDEKWNQIYALTGIGSRDENVQKQIRLGVYTYCAKNGTSREGNYEGKITIKNGNSFHASILPQALSRGHVRRFLRANSTESYHALKSSGVLLHDDRFMARCSSEGVPVEAYMARCDWFKDCPLFTPQEMLHNNRLFSVRRDAAERSRGGTLEDVENARFKSTQGAETLENNNPVSHGVW